MESYTQQAERLFNIVLSSEQIEQFSIYEKLLLEWNKKINLTAIRDVQGIHIKHFLDSLSAVKGFNGGFPTSLIDIGTGAGFPGIPLKWGKKRNSVSSLWIRLPLQGSK
jgi:16S rRNA (guanine527-N7)-methyltransferase